MSVAKLDDIGFYTMSDIRAATASHLSPLSRCEIVLTSRCNFRCPYCRSVGGEDTHYRDAADVVTRWALDGLSNIRFSGGEPTLYRGIFDLCSLARRFGIKRIAVSTNGSASPQVYDRLLSCGVNDFSISLDACCAGDAAKMAGGVAGIFETVTDNIRRLSGKTYVTVGVVLTESNIGSINGIVRLAHDLGVDDIRVIPAAQNGDRFSDVKIDADIIERHPILKYRISNMQAGNPVRGLREGDAKRCSLVLDDMAVCQGKHYPCIIYMRESGRAVGNVGCSTRKERLEWFKTHDTHADPICKNNCLDVCVDYNNKVRELRNICD